MTHARTTRLMATSAAAFLMAAAPATAVPQSVIDTIVADLAARGFDRVEIDVERNKVEVDAYGDGLEGEFYYSLDGLLLDADIDVVEGSGDTRSRAAHDDLDKDDDDRHDDDDHDDDDDDDDDDHDDDDGADDDSDDDDDDD